MLFAHARSQGLDSSDIKLDFTFDADLAKLSEQQQALNAAHKQLKEQPPPPLGGSSSSAAAAAHAHDTNDLNQKIASVKKVWDKYVSSVRHCPLIPIRVS